MHFIYFGKKHEKPFASTVGSMWTSSLQIAGNCFQFWSLKFCFLFNYQEKELNKMSKSSSHFIDIWTVIIFFSLWKENVRIKEKTETYNSFKLENRTMPPFAWIISLIRIIVKFHHEIGGWCIDLASNPTWTWRKWHRHLPAVTLDLCSCP